MAIVRSEEEILEARGQARKLTDKAEEQGGSDEAADAIYEFAGWLLGYSDELRYLETDDEDDL
jgi:hypothetical protein